jgi:hypothetical protein
LDDTVSVVGASGERDIDRVDAPDGAGRRHIRHGRWAATPGGPPARRATYRIVHTFIVNPRLTHTLGAS